MIFHEKRCPANSGAPHFFLFTFRIFSIILTPTTETDNLYMYGKDEDNDLLEEF